MFIVKFYVNWCLTELVFDYLCMSNWFFHEFSYVKISGPTFFVVSFYVICLVSWKPLIPVLCSSATAPFFIRIFVKMVNSCKIQFRTTVLFISVNNTWEEKFVKNICEGQLLIFLNKSFRRIWNNSYKQNLWTKMQI